MNKSIAYLKIAELKTYPGIYHSAQTPGWVAWASLVQLKNGDLLAGLNEVTGCRCPAKPAPLPPEAAVFGSDFYNFRGLNRTFKIIRCRNNQDKFLALWQDYYTTALGDSLWQPSIYLLGKTARGTLLRCTQGRRLPGGYACGALSRSMDNGRTWGEFAPIQEKDKVLYICRVIQLRDGRLLMSAYDIANGTCLLVSKDDGLSWSKPIPAMRNDARIQYNETAIIEASNGDILMLARVHDLTDHPRLDATREKKNPRENRSQMRLKRQGKVWVPGPIKVTAIPHGGHPELLMTREGILIYSSAEGFWGSANEGREWTRIETLPIASYYPASVQLQDGRILVVGHNGGDAGYPPTADMMLWKVSFRIS